jgi:hypothetical protein
MTFLGTHPSAASAFGTTTTTTTTTAAETETAIAAVDKVHLDKHAGLETR